MLDSCSRTLRDMQNNTLSHIFNRVKNKADALEIKKTDAKFIKRAIDDVKYYMQTLIGEQKPDFKDNFGIRIEVLRPRLEKIEDLVDQILEAQKNPDEEMKLIEIYEKVKNSIEYGFFRSSNLENIIHTSIDLIEKEKLEMTIPDRLKCPISLEIMLDPVIASDGVSYERREIEQHIKRRGGMGNACSPITGKILTGSLNPNTSLKEEIEKLCEKFPMWKNEIYSHKK